MTEDTLSFLWLIALILVPVALVVRSFLVGGRLVAMLEGRGPCTRVERREGCDCNHCRGRCLCASRAAAAMAAGVASVPGRRIVHPPAGDHRRDDFRVEVFPRVAVEHDEVGVVAGDQRPPPALVARDPRRRDARGTERLVDREALLRVPGVALVDRPEDPGSD